MKNEIYDRLVEDYRAGRKPSGEWNPILLRAYMHRYEKNELLDFDGLIDEEKIPALVKELRRAGIHEFTISSGWSGLISRLFIWEREGARICGTTTTVKLDCADEEVTRPALYMKL